ncbi:UNVERIFIED_ORG: hypothetical protein M2414_005374 [Rahnella aquatilis]
MSHFDTVKYLNGDFLAIDTFSRKALFTSSDGRNWVNLFTSQNNGNPYNIAYGNGTYVIVGSNGMIFTATDFDSWENRSLNTSDTFYDITFGNDKFVAVGSNGVMVTSTNGINWDKTSHSVSEIYSILYDHGTFVAVDISGVILTSTDAVQWKTIKTEIKDIETMAYGNGIYVAAGPEKNTILISANLKSWTVVYSDQSSGLDGKIYSVIFGNNTFIAVSGLGEILKSASGAKWEEAMINANPPKTGTHNKLTGVTCNSNLFLAVGDLVHNSEGPISGIVLSSYDNGLNWGINDSNFTWNSQENQFYNKGNGSQLISMSSFDKDIGFDFTMDAPGEVLELHATSLQNAFIWGNGENNPSKHSSIHIKNGTLKVQSEKTVEFGVNAYAPKVINDLQISIDKDAVLELYNTSLNSTDGKASATWNIKGEFNIQRGIVSSPMTLNVQDNGSIQMDVWILDVLGKWYINSSPLKEGDHSCKLSAFNLNISGKLEMIGISNAILTAKQYLDVGGILQVTDKATLTVNCEAPPTGKPDFGIMGEGKFELGIGTSHTLTIGSDDNPFPVNIQRSDSTTGRLAGFFNFLSNEENRSDNTGVFILKNMDSQIAFEIRDGKYITINDKPATYNVDFKFDKIGNTKDHMIKLIQK